MTTAYQREELHKLIDQLDEKKLSKALALFKNFSFRKKPNAASDPLKVIYSKIESFTQLPHNWDGYGAIPVNEKTASSCIYFFKKLPTNLLRKIELENITPTPYNTVTIDWENEKGNFVSVEIGRGAANFYGEINEEENIEMERTGIEKEGLYTALKKCFEKTLLENYFMKTEISPEINDDENFSKGHRPSVDVFKIKKKG